MKKRYICIVLALTLIFGSAVNTFGAATSSNNPVTVNTTTASAITATAAAITATSSAITTTSPAVTTTTGGAASNGQSNTTSEAALTTIAKKETQKLSLEQALTIMKTTGAQAESADLGKQSDQAVAKGYSETVRKLRKASNDLDELQNYPSAVLTKMGVNVVDLSYEAQELGVTSNNKKIMNLRREFATNNIENNYQADLNQIELDTINIYYKVLLAQENLSIAKDNLAAQQKTLKNTEAKKDVGMLSKSDVLKAESAVADAESQVRKAETDLKYAKMSFNYLLGFNVMQDVVFTDTLSEPKDNSADVETAVTNSLNNRNEIRGVDYAKDIYAILLQDVFNYSKASSTYLNAKINLQQAEKNTKDVRSKIELDTRNKYDVLQDKKAAVDAAKNLQAYAKEGLRLVTLTTDEGLTTTEDLLEAQVNAYKANLNLANANMEYILQMRSYEFAQGIGTTRIPL